MTDNPSSNFAPRFALSLEVELQRHEDPASGWTTAKLRDISVKDFYFFSDVRYETGTRFNFSIPLQPGQTDGGRCLLSGIASIVCCEELPSSEASAAFGILARVDEATP